MIEYLKTYWSLKHDQRAVTALEYALIAGLISVVLVAAVGTFGSKLSGVFTSIGTTLGTAAVTG
ncbi:Flp family type IVb pilin [Lichenicola cladoniae]|uniref:Flp family type IVb pilin n=1 Tax=Lichenicola cladoniae TaxID=1484109 RepID=A0A6M8H6R4_9PROT|nr:Flp family type IVb pilin [Lichenicola cladoniae]NPD69204.1 Flp family type IVb pilin [Acetobacteraceae bacterium]QKE89031.1 Flp family type IVb pilin [Lichenicola cladoniae]